MMAAGRWQAAATAADPATIGFHLSALYSPVGWLSWTGIARMWEAAQATDEAKRSFQNSVLGETWIETGEAPDWQRLYERREAWRIGTVPIGGLFLTAGADVQKDRIEVSIWAWGRGLTSWLVDHIVIAGGPESQASWGELTSLLSDIQYHRQNARRLVAAIAHPRQSKCELRNRGAARQPPR
jgi:phage terminase large subunit GpA-like protein